MFAEAQTLSHKLALRKMTISEALRYAIQIGAALQRIHESGSFHGRVTTDAVLVTDTEARLLPPDALADGTLCSAPELLDGHPADCRSDIFAFGTVIYQMLSGRNAASEPEPIGDPALDRLLASCLKKNPAERRQRIQQVVTELRLLSIVACGAEKNSVVSRQKQFQEAVQATLVRHEHAMSELEHAVVKHSNALETAVTETLDAVRAQLGADESRLVAAEERASVSERTVAGTIETARQEIAALRQHIEESTRSAADGYVEHGVAVDALRGDVARLDSLMEGVVDALETLQNMLVDQDEVARRERALVAA